MPILVGQRYQLMDGENGEIVEVIFVKSYRVGVKTIQIFGRGIFSKLGKEDTYPDHNFDGGPGNFRLLEGQEAPK